jgi:putative adhesin
MKPRSIVGPLVLIATGGLLLAREIIPGFRVADFVSRYWPLLLIAWGSLHIVEVLVWRAKTKPLPARTISGGEWLLIVILCLAGAGIHAAHRIDFRFPDHLDMREIMVFGGRYEFPLSEEKASSRVPHIVLEDFRGEARIAGTDTGPDVVKIAGRKIVHSFDQATADQANGETPLAITGDEGNLVIRMQQPAHSPQRISASIDITVPKGASIEVRGGNAALMRMESLQGAIAISGRGANIELENVGGPANIDGTFSGTIQVKNLAKALHFTGRQTELSMERVTGQLRVERRDLTADDVSGVRINSRSHDVRITDFTGDLQVDVDRGDLELSTKHLPVGRIQARSKSGDIRLALPPAAQFTLSASTARGEISNTFGGALKLDQSRRQARLSGSNGAGPSIDLETNRGDIVLEKTPETTVTTRPLQKLDQ